MDRATVTRALLFASAAAGPAMLIVLALRLAGAIDPTAAVIDLVVLLVVGVAATLLARVLTR
jgi:hypothetical protein